MNIDYLKIQKEATMLNISPFLLVKRKINYRKCNKNELDCRSCEHFRTPINKKKNCEIIGISLDFYAFVNKDYICDYYESVKSLNDCLCNHEFEKYIRRN